VFCGTPVINGTASCLGWLALQADTDIGTSTVPITKYQARCARAQYSGSVPHYQSILVSGELSRNIHNISLDGNIL
jgi:hypothetical protein